MAAVKARECDERKKRLKLMVEAWLNVDVAPRVEGAKVPEIDGV